MREQLDKIIDKLKHKKKYKKFGIDISNAIFCYGKTSDFTSQRYIIALAGELGRNLIEVPGMDSK